MIRRFCDRCNREVTEANTGNNRILRMEGRFKVEVHVAVDGTWNSGDVCARCVVELVNIDPVKVARVSHFSDIKLPEPPDGITKVRSSAHEVWRSRDDGQWEARTATGKSTPGSWYDLLRVYGPVTEVLGDD